MPVKKFRSVEEMGDNTWLEPTDPRLPTRIRKLWRFSAKVAPKRFPPGVHKHRTMAEANAWSDYWLNHDQKS